MNFIKDMVWSEIDIDGKARFLRKEGEEVVLTKEKRGNLADEVPQGFKVIKKNKRLKLIRG